MRNDRQTPFKEQLINASKSIKSRVVLAIDVHDGQPRSVTDKTFNIIQTTHQSICGVKFGRQTILSLGPRESVGLLRRIHELGLPTIIDDKLNDIDETNVAIARRYFELGFDAITVNPFAGWEGGLETTFKFARRSGMGIIALVYMSHRGASEGYGQRVLRDGRKRPQFEVFAEKAVEWKADGAVVGATRPDIVRRAKEILRDKVMIFSPGVGVQGGDVSRSLRAGTDYFIIGRSITKARSPQRAARDFAVASVALGY